MKNKNYRGLVVVAPPHLNPKNEANRYVFSGVEIPMCENFAHLFRIIPLPGTVTPQAFAEDVKAQNPLPVDLELFATTFDFGRLRYVRVATGETESARADDVTGLPPAHMNAPHQPERVPGRTEEAPEWTPPEPEPPTPGPEF